MIKGTILEHLEDRKFVVEIPEEEGNLLVPGMKRLTIAHDYIQFGGNTTYYMKADKNGKYPIEGDGASNHLRSSCDLQIGIRDFKEFYLPMILQHEYFQDEHLEDRTYDEDDTTWEKKGFEEPRWKKGDKYLSYAYSPSVIRYYDRISKTSMVAFRAKGEVHYSRVSLDIYDKIKETLNLHKLDEAFIERYKKRENL